MKEKTIDNPKSKERVMKTLKAQINHRARPKITQLP